jgi:hypothetical protein
MRRKAPVDRCIDQRVPSGQTCNQLFNDCRNRAVATVPHYVQIRCVLGEARELPDVSIGATHSLDPQILQLTPVPHDRSRRDKSFQRCAEHRLCAEQQLEAIQTQKYICGVGPNPSRTTRKPPARRPSMSAHSRAAELRRPSRHTATRRLPRAIATVA